MYSPRRPARLLTMTHRGLTLLGLLLGASTALAAAPGAKIRADVLYHNYCSVCHGDKGDGRSRARSSLQPPPKDFTNGPQMPREAMIAVVRDGKPGTAMVGWKTQLSDKEVAAVVDYVRNTFMRVTLDPKLARGRSVYGHNCVACHGDRGQGVVLPGGDPHRPPRDFTTAAAAKDMTRQRMIDAVTLGRPGTAMASFRDRLPKEDIEAAVDYIREVLIPAAAARGASGTVAHGGRERDGAPAVDMAAPLPNGLVGDVRKGEAFYMRNCATCHGVKGDGQGPRAYFIRPVPRNFLEASSRERLNRPAIFEATRMGRLGTEMPAWSKVIDDQQIADISEFVYQRYIRPKGTQQRAKR